MEWARRVVATRTFKVVFAAIVAVLVLGAIFGNPDDSDEQALTTTTTTTLPPPRVISTTTPTITVSPTDTKLPPIDHSQTPTTRRRSPAYCDQYGAGDRFPECPKIARSTQPAPPPQRPQAATTWEEEMALTVCLSLELGVTWEEILLNLALVADERGWSDAELREFGELIGIGILAFCPEQVDKIP